MAAIVWLVVAISLAVAEVLSGDLFLLMLSGGALVTSGAAFVLSDSLWAQGGTFAVASIALLFGVRPFLKRRLATPHTPMGMLALEGKQAVVLAPVSADGGQVKLAGEVWSAKPMDELDAYAVGTAVRVMKIDGATAIVWKEP